MEIAILFIMIIIAILVNAILLKGNRRHKYDKLTWKDIVIVKQYMQMCSPREFETFCAMLFSIQGMRTHLTDPTDDLGKDIIVYPNDYKEYHIECNLYDPESNNKVTRVIAQKLAGSICYEQKRTSRQVCGLIMTTSEFTHDCNEYCRDMGIEMYGTERILRMVERIGTSKVLLACGISEDYVPEKHKKANFEVDPGTI